MAILSSVLRVLSDFGDAAGWLIASVVLFAYGRRILAENEKAHAALDKKIDEKIDTVDRKIDTVDRKIDTVAQGLEKKIDSVAQVVAAIARDVAFLAGRQTERDRTTGRQA